MHINQQGIDDFLVSPGKQFVSDSFFSLPLRISHQESLEENPGWRGESLLTVELPTKGGTALCRKALLAALTSC